MKIAKQKNIKKSSNADRPQSGIPVPPANAAGLKRATLLFGKFRTAGEATVGHSMMYDELSILTNEPRSTLGRWFNGDGEPSSESLLRLLELTSEARRHEIMDKPPFCRVYPRLDHPWLSHDLAAISHMQAIASKLTGITLIRGDDESRVTFLATALAHAARSLPKPGRQVAGLDLHAPDWFVPVPGLTYLNNELHPGRIREELDKLRPMITSCKGALIIFNGALALVSVSNESIQALARHSHVVVADWLRPKVQPAALAPAPETLGFPRRDVRVEPCFW